MQEKLHDGFGGLEALDKATIIDRVDLDQHTEYYYDLRERGLSRPGAAWGL